MKVKNLIFLIILLIISSCEKEEEPTRTEDNLVQNLTSGPWGISFFVMDGVDRVNDFEGVNFTFLSNGQVEAFRGTQLLAQGEWSTRFASGRIEVQTAFSAVPMFQNLNAVWYQDYVISHRIILRKIDSEDYLIFEK